MNGQDHNHPDTGWIQEPQFYLAWETELNLEAPPVQTTCSAGTAGHKIPVSGNNDQTAELWVLRKACKQFFHRYISFLALQ